MKNLTWQNPEQLFVAQELINKVKSKCCGIKGEKYQVYLLSNTNPIIQLEWAQTKEFTPAGRPLNDYFDKLYLSYEIGVTKPDREIFDRMVLDSGIRPEETLFVDDGKNNIVVGQELGFHTYQPLNGEDWRGRLDEILSKS